MVLLINWTRKSLNNLHLITGFVVLVSFSGIAYMGEPQPITFNIGGVVTDVFDENNLLGGAIVPGDPWSAQYTFSADALDVLPGNPLVGIYNYDDINLIIDPLHFSNAPPLNDFDGIVIVGNDVGTDEYGIQDLSLNQQAGPPIPDDDIFFQVLIDDLDLTAFVDDSLPLTPPDISDFELTAMVLEISSIENNLESLESILEKGKTLFSKNINELNQVGGITILGNVQSISKVDDVVGGELIPIETTSLILASAQSFSWMIPVVLSGIGIGLFVVSRKS